MKGIYARVFGCCVLFLCGQVPAAAEARCEPDGIQASGAVYRICLPAAVPYNGRLVVWAHGFQDAGEPVGIPEDQLRTRNGAIQDFVTGLGFGFATTSYSKTGLAVREGQADIVDLVGLYGTVAGTPDATYLFGASEGGLIAALLVERRPDLFAAGLAACGPVGDLSAQFNYIGDARATFDYFFPGLIPDQGDPFHPTPDLIAAWPELYATDIRPQLLATDNRPRLNRWARVAQLAYSPRRAAATREQTGGEVLGYAVKNLNDAAATLGGFPYGNRFRRYRGSPDDADLNARVPRIAADPAALQEIQDFYTTSGRLRRPLVTLHSSRDSLVPYRQEMLYRAKTGSDADSRRRHVNIRTSGYGHCRFSEAEVLLAVATLGALAGENAFVDNTLTNTVEPVLRREFRRLSSLNRLRVELGDGRFRIKLP